jgi:hypothetical protein
MDYNLKETFRVNSPVRMETSTSVLDSEKSTELEITVGVDTDSEYGFFELFDTDSQGERFYGEGGLWFDGKKLTDYDGVFELSNHVVNKLKEWGFDTSEIE